MEAYKDEQTPFLSKHTCGKEPITVSASTFHRAYGPTQLVQVGELAAACYGAVNIVGEIQQIIKKNGKVYVTFVNKANKLYLFEKCVRLPVINEFVRHKQTKKWYKVHSVGANGALGLLPVLKETQATVTKTKKKKKKAKAKKKASTKNTTAADDDSDAATAAGSDAALGYDDDIGIEDILPRHICRDGLLLSDHTDYWLENLPDMTDLAVIRHDQLQFWTKQKRKDKTKAHTSLKGLKASWTNASIDFCISQNKWPVIFEDENGQVVDLSDEFVLVFWVSYVRHMVLACMLLSNTYKTLIL